MHFSPWSSVTTPLLLCSEHITAAKRGTNLTVTTQEKIAAAKLPAASTHCASRTWVTSPRPGSLSTIPDKETATNHLTLSALRGRGGNEVGGGGAPQPKDHRRVPSQVCLAACVSSSSASAGTAWASGESGESVYTRETGQGPDRASPGKRAPPPPGPRHPEPPMPRLQPSADTTPLCRAPATRQALRDPRHCWGCRAKPQIVSGLTLGSPGWGVANAENKCVFHALGLFRRVCGGWMKPPSQVGIPSELPRPRGPDVLQAQGGAGAEVPDGAPFAPREAAPGPPGASGHTCLLLPSPKPLLRCLHQESKLGGGHGTTCGTCEAQRLRTVGPGSKSMKFRGGHSRALIPTQGPSEPGPQVTSQATYLGSWRLPSPSRLLPRPPWAGHPWVEALAPCPHRGQPRPWSLSQGSHEDTGWAMFYWVIPLPNGWAALHGSCCCFLQKLPVTTSLHGADCRARPGPKSLSPPPWWESGARHLGRGDERPGSLSDQPHLPNSRAGGASSRPRTIDPLLVPWRGRSGTRGRSGISVSWIYSARATGGDPAHWAWRKELVTHTVSCKHASEQLQGRRVGGSERGSAWPGATQPAPAPLPDTVILPSGLTVGQALAQRRAEGKTSPVPPQTGASQARGWTGWGPQSLWLHQGGGGGTWH